MLEEIRVIVFRYLLPILMVFVGLYLARKTDLLKDQSTSSEKPYSFSRSQLLWWTLIILCCFSIYYGTVGEIQKINKSSLILLGISLGTTTAARVIDSTEVSNNIPRHQDRLDKKGFMYNILSDENGISIHRFQAVVFNLIFGLIFIMKFASNGIFEAFGEWELGLMGISSAAYVGLKVSENRESKT
ncbi:hypothetical protein [Flavivirga jejuensis]|uniref:SdpI/YhfL family protein n=1 Tax=Flavivirga jejuensis TaxID=870487 RepID=A0ABT8WTD0_9FLAO|nr:hypothetical protein [Flavivirga jejuensis]MDO5976151.1 hypothetical protein [Flavivirga jejuensis]